MEKLTKLGDPLQTLIEKDVIEGLFETFNTTLDAKAKIGIMNLTYNICRCTQLKIAVAPVVNNAGLMGYLPACKAGGCLNIKF